jgi:hypothetical protein
LDDRFFEKHEYHALTPAQKDTLSLKRLKRGHVGKTILEMEMEMGENSGKGPTIKSLTCSIAAMTNKIDKLILSDEDEYSKKEEGTSNCSNAALTRQIKKKKHGNN